MEKEALNLPLYEFLYWITDLSKVILDTTPEAQISPQEIYKYLHKETNGFDRQLTIVTYHSVEVFFVGRVSAMREESADLYNKFGWEMPRNSENEVDFKSMLERTHEWPLLWMDYVYLYLEGNMNNGDSLPSIFGRRDLPVGLNTKLGHRQASSLFDWLKKGGYIDKDADCNSFTWALGGAPVDAYRPIVWLKTKQLLRELLEGVATDSKANIERRVRQLFVDQSGAPYALAKNKQVPSQESDSIADFLATLQVVDSQ